MSMTIGAYSLQFGRGMQVMGSVVAIVVAMVVCPVSGVISSTAAATEVLAEMELAAVELRDGVSRLISAGQSTRQAAGVEGGTKPEEGRGAPPSQGVHASEGAPPSEGCSGGDSSSNSSLCWAAAHEALGRAEAASARMAVHLSSVTAFPLSLLLGKGLKGNQMLRRLCSLAPELSKALQVPVQWDSDGSGAGMDCKCLAGA